MEETKKDKTEEVKELRLEETPEFLELMDNNTESELKEMLKGEDIIGLEFITGKKALIATILNLRKRKEEAAKVAPVVTPTITNLQAQVGSTWQRKLNIMKELCAKAPKVKIMIPFEIGERTGAVADLQINGYKLSVMKGVYVDIPEPFAEMVQESWQQTSQAGQEKLLNRTDPETGKPMNESTALS